jgi:hypothetical protein
LKALKRQRVTAREPFIQKYNRFLWKTLLVIWLVPLFAILFGSLFPLYLIVAQAVNKPMSDR